MKRMTFAHSSRSSGPRSSHPQRSGRRRPRVAPALALVLLVAVVVLLSPQASAAGAVQEKAWTIDSLDVALDVQENGDVIVDETLTVYFQGNFHYFAHDIPTANYEGISEVEVRDEDGYALPMGSSTDTYEVSEEGDVTTILVNFDLTDTTGTWTFHYRAKQVVLFGPDDDALEWYVFDDVNPVAIGEARATVRLPGSVPPSELMSKTTIDVGDAPGQNVYSPVASTVVFEATEIPAYQYFWLKAGFPKGLVFDHWTAREVMSFIVPKLGFVLPIFTFLIVLLIWFRRGRDDPSATYAKYVSDPPSDLSPGLVGALIDEQVDTKEVMATIVDLARRGYLEMAEGEKGSAMTFTRVKPLSELQGFEKTVAEALFDSSHPDEVTTAQLKNHFYVHVGPIVDQVYREVTSAGYFRSDPKKTRRAWILYGGLMIGVAILISYILSKARVDGWGYFMTGAVFSAVIMWIFGRRMPGRTAKGSQEQRKWEAFRNYLKDLTRFQEMEAAKEKYETALPYAIALGVEKEWTRRFEDMTVSSPDWYHPPIVIVHTGRDTAGPSIPGGGGGGLGGGMAAGGGGFSLDDVSGGLFGALGKVSSAMTSAPSSASGGHGAFGGGGSGGGGFGGGGFSGGGGGGGGFRAG